LHNNASEADVKNPAGISSVFVPFAHPLWFQGLLPRRLLPFARLARQGQPVSQLGFQCFGDSTKCLSPNHKVLAGYRFKLDAERCWIPDTRFLIN
jgi:hypothetical protein